MYLLYKCSAKMHVLRIRLTSDKNIRSVCKGRYLFLYLYFCTVGSKTNINTTFSPVLLYCPCKQKDLSSIYIHYEHIIYHTAR